VKLKLNFISPSSCSDAHLHVCTAVSNTTQIGRNSRTYSDSPLPGSVHVSTENMFWCLRFRDWRFDFEFRLLPSTKISGSPCSCTCSSPNCSKQFRTTQKRCESIFSSFTSSSSYRHRNIAEFGYYVDLKKETAIFKNNFLLSATATTHSNEVLRMYILG
jgi:hypothetical protein